RHRVFPHQLLRGKYLRARMGEVYRHSCSLVEHRGLHQRFEGQRVFHSHSTPDHRLNAATGRLEANSLVPYPPGPCAIPQRRRFPGHCGEIKTEHKKHKKHKREIRFCASCAFCVPFFRYAGFLSFSKRMRSSSTNSLTTGWSLAYSSSMDPTNTNLPLFKRATRSATFSAQLAIS